MSDLGPPPPPPPGPPPGGWPQQPYQAPQNWQPLAQAGPSTYGNAGLAVVLGLVCAAGGGAVWCAIVAITNYQIAYLALALGWFTAQGVLAGSNAKPRIVHALLAGVFTAASCVVSQYYIVKIELGQAGFRTTMPAVPGPADIGDVVSATMDNDPLTGLFWAAAVIAAIVVAASSPRSIFRPGA